jgi:dienelactone hydrolase
MCCTLILQRPAFARPVADVTGGAPEDDAARIGTIGFCFGGTMSLELARSGADIKAVVGFHSGLATVAPKTDAKSWPFRNNSYVAKRILH